MRSTAEDIFRFEQYSSFSVKAIDDVLESVEITYSDSGTVLESKKFYKDRHGKNCVFAVLFVAVWMLLEEVPGRPTV